MPQVAENVLAGGEHEEVLAGAEGVGLGGHRLDRDGRGGCAAALSSPV